MICFSSSLDFVWFSKAVGESRLYAPMEATDLSAKSPFPHPEKGATFEEYVLFSLLVSLMFVFFFLSVIFVCVTAFVPRAKRRRCER